MENPDGYTRYTRHISGRPNQRRGHGAVQAPSPFAPQHAAQTIACRWNVVLALERSNFRVWKQQEGHYLDKNASQIHWSCTEEYTTTKSTPSLASKEFGRIRARNEQNLQNDLLGPLWLTKTAGKGPVTSLQISECCCHELGFDRPHLRACSGPAAFAVSQPCLWKHGRWDLIWNWESKLSRHQLKLLNSFCSQYDLLLGVPPTADVTASEFDKKIRPHRFGGEGVLIGGQQQH